jgi:branched-chain amino acid transport system permease protein
VKGRIAMKFDVMRATWPAVSVSILLMLVATLAVLLGTQSLQQIVTEMMIQVMVVVGMYIFIGNSGVLSFGHVGFMAIGAYGAAWLTCCTLPLVKPLYLPGLPEFLSQHTYPFVLGLISASLFSGIASLIVGVAILRLAGIGASIATFAFLAIVYTIYSNWSSVTGGASSISNIPVSIGPCLATLGAIGIVWVAFLHQTSRYGLMLRATRDDAVAARSSGIKIMQVRLIAFVLSALCVGIAGAFYSSFMGILSVDAFYLPLTFMTLAMLIVGGLGSLAGAVVGVMLVTLTTGSLRLLENGITLGTVAIQLPRGLQELGLGIFMVLALILRPTGIMNGSELPFPRGAKME